MASAFGHVKLAPPNAIFYTKTRFKNDPSPKKVNLGVGAYRDAAGKPWVLPTVKMAEGAIFKGLLDGSQNHEYLPITGLESFISAAAVLAFGSKSSMIASKRISGVQALSGTGALRLGAEFLAQNMNTSGGPVVCYQSNPTWGNHNKIFTLAGCTVKQYRYYKPSTRGFDFEGMLADLSDAKPGSVVLLHACAHNPTGVDPTQEQWRKIADVVQSRGIFPFFDSAYQGFATGSLEKDAYAIRLFAERGMPLFLAQSFSKNFGLYNERAGCLQMLCGTPDEAAALKSQVALIIRAMYSNPPNHGARIVSTALASKEMYAQWQKDITLMADRIFQMRALLVEELHKRKVPGSWRHITDQIGMFSFTGLTPEQVDFIEAKYHVYMLRSGRISMAGLNESNVGHIADAMADAIGSVEAKL